MSTSGPPALTQSEVRTRRAVKAAGMSPISGLAVQAAQREAAARPFLLAHVLTVSASSISGAGGGSASLVIDNDSGAVVIVAAGGGGAGGSSARGERKKRLRIVSDRSQEVEVTPASTWA